MTIYHYGNRMLRNTLAQILIQTICDAEIISFWDAYIQKNKKLFVESVNEVFDIYCSRHVGDGRSFKIIYDSFEYCIQHVDKFYNEFSEDYNAPNIVALSMMTQNINAYYLKTGHRIEFAYHDQQNQFGKELETVFNTMKNLHSNQGPESFLSDFKKTELFTCDLKMIPGNSNFGLQFADLFLYLFVQNEKNKLNNAPNCISFLNKHSESTRLFEITREQLFFEVRIYNSIAKNKKLSPMEMARGQELLKRLENNRWKQN